MTCRTICILFYQLLSGTMCVVIDVRKNDISLHEHPLESWQGYVDIPYNTTCTFMSDCNHVVIRPIQTENQVVTMIK